MNDQNNELRKNPIRIEAMYKEVYGRRNVIRPLILNLFYDISSTPRIMMEVFIRRSLGERYFSIEQCLFVTLVMLLGPYIYFKSLYHQEFWDTLKGNWAWYLYSVAFAVMSYIRWKEIKREPSVFELGKFSLSAGLWLPFFDRIQPFGKPLNARQISTYYEPLIFLAAGIVFYLMRQTVAFVFIWIAIVYSISYMAAYKLGDDFVMDKLDKIICNEQLYDTFVQKKHPSQTKGFNPPMSGPSLFDIRDELYDTFLDDVPQEAASVN